MTIPIFRVGGLIRIDRVNSDDNHNLTVGEVVTIVSVGQDASGDPFAVVAPGDCAVYLRDTSPVATHDELHPEDAMPDDAADEKFDEMTDLLLHEFYGLTMDEVAAKIAQGEDGPVEDRRTPPTTPGPPAQSGNTAVLDQPSTPANAPQYVVNPAEDLFAYVDHDGDRVQFIYHERYPDGGVVGFVRVVVNGSAACDLPIGTLIGLTRFFAQATKKFARRSRERRGGGA